ncbi:MULTISPECIES: HPr family phosphocarrier protein [Brevibacillus]|uniref:Phosphocarrier protein HPr n=1 Tax=Brevibacillus invocatus TaxID=173959 RepID=A0A3M8CK02_9BACL|nr:MULTISPECIES: HPr family phosphocarrier protein [Brevibacillus]MCM3077656.1 HPr family phosphocarrier protein [Brevibacillus invocatus]MCM3428658.1 HPr family phosphocarrier protein [Brevibacillus invocatus]MDH4617454.1 HPr family phosphocarrier protein [Brevibacillus sp. AY1]RNB75891.1 HPr family phosphocarrier protein [Brevibacillus invocatus]
MIRFTEIVNVSGGLHARPASVLVNKLNQYGSTVKILYQNKQANGKSILNVMALGAKTGDEVTFEIEGSDEQEAADGIRELFQRDFAV